MKKLATTIYLFAMLISPFYLAQSSKNLPQLGAIFPAGGQRGTTVDVLVYGQRVNKAKLVITDEMVKGEIVHSFMTGFEALKGEERETLKSILKLVEEKKEIPKEELDKLLDREFLWPLKRPEGNPTDEEIRRINYQYFSSKRYKRPPQTLLHATLVRLTIHPKAKLGPREIRFKTWAGLSKPLYFVVGNLPEMNEIEPLSPKEVVPSVKWPVCINGQLEEKDHDSFTFHAKKGQKLSINATARELNPFIADGVPGWFEAILVLYGPDGKELSYSDCTNFRPDPTFNFTVLKTGAYRIEIRDSIYRGRRDFVYRLTIDKYKSKKGYKFPHVIAKKGDVNRHVFSAAKGYPLSIRTTARSLGSPIDTFIQILDPKGNVLTQNDDSPAPLRIGRHTAFTDSSLKFNPPETGKYILQVSDTAQLGGPEYGYKYSINSPKPQFDLFVSPPLINLTRTGSGTITFHAVRREGFKGKISIGIDGKAGFTLDGAVIPPGSNAITAILRAPLRKVRESSFKLTFTGRGKAGNRAVSSQAIPAESWQQAFLWRHLMPVDEFEVKTKKGRSKFNKFFLRTDKPIQFRKKEISTAVLSCGELPEEGTLQYRILSAPKGVAIEKNELSERKIKLGLTSSVPVKGSGNIIIEIFSSREVVRNEKKRKIEVPLGILPPIPYKQ